MATKFYLETRPNKHGEVLIRCSISIKGKRFLTTAGVTVSPNAWSDERQQVKASLSGRPVVNAKGMTAKAINARLKAIDTYFASLELSTDKKTDIDLRQAFAKHFGKGGKTGEKKESTLFYAFDEFTSTMGAQNAWTKAMFEKFAALRAQLQGFAGVGAQFSALDTKGLTDFVEHLRNEQHMKNSTIDKKIAILKYFLRWSEGRGYAPNPDFKTFNPKLKKASNKVVFLTWDELMRVYSFKFPKLGKEVTITDMNGEEYKKTVSYEPKTLERVRDVFCFCCFTSLRYSDAANLRRECVFDDHISLTTIKTADTLTIELNKYARAILEKYKDSDFPYNRALPVISNQRMNEYLKEMAELCGLNEPITKTYYRGNERIDEVKPKWAYVGTHTARRTFICNALSLGIAPQIVMKWTGHSDYKSMKPYIDIADQAKADAMKLFDRE